MENLKKWNINIGRGYKFLCLIKDL